jgi:hypothetical protein
MNAVSTCSVNIFEVESTYSISHLGKLRCRKLAKELGLVFAHIQHSAAESLFRENMVSV